MLDRFVQAVELREESDELGAEELHLRARSKPEDS